MENIEVNVSIIIPVYNAERYLDECLKSIERQTLENLEVICVNDGSTDRSIEIVKKYVNKDSRFFLLGTII